MIQIKMQVTNGEPKYFNACEVLEKINNEEILSVLISMGWNKDQNKIDFLTGKNTHTSTVAIIDEYLTEEQAKQAIEEYHSLGYAR